MRPQQVVGMHFCLPAQLMKLVELTPGLLTSERTLATAESLCRSFGQIPIRTKDTPGFILNHFVIPFNNDAIRLVERGVAAPRISTGRSAKSLGHPMGPLQLVDLVDSTRRFGSVKLSTKFETLGTYARPATPDGGCRHLGKKSGQGFYRYESTGTFGA